MAKKKIIPMPVCVHGYPFSSATRRPTCGEEKCNDEKYIAEQMLSLYNDDRYFEDGPGEFRRRRPEYTY